MPLTAAFLYYPGGTGGTGDIGLTGGTGAQGANPSIFLQNEGFDGQNPETLLFIDMTPPLPSRHCSVCAAISKGQAPHAGLSWKQRADSHAMRSAVR